MLLLKFKLYVYFIFSSFFFFSVIIKVKIAVSLALQKSPPYSLTLAGITVCGKVWNGKFVFQSHFRLWKMDFKPCSHVHELSLEIDHNKKHAYAFIKQYLADLLPIINWLPRYNRGWLMGDIIAGVTVGIVVIPQVNIGIYITLY